MLAVPLGVAAAAFLLLLTATDAARSFSSIVMFTLIAFVLAVVAQEFARGTAARRVMSRESWPAAAASLVARNRRRHGGYLVHAGMAILFLGVAASSAFQAQRDIRLLPGQSTRLDGYTIAYRRPTAAILDDRAGTGAPVSFGAVLDVRKGRQHWVMRPSRNYYAATDGSGGAIGRFFMGDSTSEVDLRWGLKRDVWSAIQPDLSSLITPIRVANRKFGNAPGRVQAVIIAALADRYRMHSSPATFRFIVSPMIAWIWIGGAI